MLKEQKARLEINMYILYSMVYMITYTYVYGMYTCTYTRYIVQTLFFLGIHTKESRDSLSCFCKVWKIKFSH